MEKEVDLSGFVLLYKHYNLIPYQVQVFNGQLVTH